MLPTQQLQDQAVKNCEAHVKSVLTGEFLIEPGEPQVTWNEVQLRRIFDQPLVVWRKCSNFDVVLDDQDRPVGYVNADKYLNSQYRPMSEREIVKLAAETGFVPEGAGVLSMGPGPQGCLEAILATQPERADSPRYLVRINPVRGALIAIVPEGVTP